MTNILEINNLSMHFGKSTILNQINLAVPENSIYGFLGKNGAGKTTTMKLILGLLKPSGGTIHVNQQLVSWKHNKTNAYIGYLPDVPEYYNYMKPREYLTLCGEISQIPKNELSQRVDSLLQSVGLDQANKRIGGFSRGMKQRLGIAQALLHRPKLLICDEPTSALDPIGRKEILELLLQLKGETTVLFSTHILADIERICDHVAILDQGKLVLNGEISELKKHRRQDQLSIVFQTNTECSEFYNLLSPTQQALSNVSNEQITLMLQDYNKEYNEILKMLSLHSWLPLKMERLEPSLEQLFEEVISL